MKCFIQQFAKCTPQYSVADTSLGTQTMTKTLEGEDQDAHSKNLFSLGTMTCTESLEGSDQDHHLDFYLSNKSL